MDDLKLYGKDEIQLESLVHTVRVFTQDNGMQFDIEKCAVLILKRGKVVHLDGIQLLGDNKIKTLKDGEGYKYLGVMEANELLHDKVKESS